MLWLARDLSAAGVDNQITVSQSEDDADNALRLELSNAAAVPATTGWNNYMYVYGSSS
jgi:hypothetical protein